MLTIVIYYRLQYSLVIVASGVRVIMLVVTDIKIVYAHSATVLLICTSIFTSFKGPIAAQMGRINIAFMKVLRFLQFPV